MRKYSLLRVEERYQIYALMEMKVRKEKIAERLGRDRATIYREIRRNREEEGYLPMVANKKAELRKKNKRKGKIESQKELKDYIVEKLKTGWSPEQIVGRMKKEKREETVCVETVYRYIYRKKNTEALYEYLPYRRKKRRKGFRSRKEECRYGRIRLITERPKKIEKRKEWGHWEGDSILFGKNRKEMVITAVERKSRLALLLKSERMDTKTVMGHIKDFFTRQPKKSVLSITFDQGSEFANYEQLQRATDCRVYYCHKRAPWEKGSNENLNGRIRRYLPKEMDIRTVMQEDLNRLAERLNTTPRKCLEYQTPKECYLRSGRKLYGLIQ